jgi:hypothetical protein
LNISFNRAGVQLTLIPDYVSMMEIRSPAHLLGAALVPVPAPQAVSLKLGAILDVIVQAQLDENRFRLQRLPDGEFLTGISRAELSVGQRLRVEVTGGGALPELRILPPESQPLEVEVVPKALCELLPKQVDIRELATLLRQLPVPNSPSLPDPVNLSVERFIAALPRAEKLMTPDGLQKAIQNSGLFLEASLAAVLSDGAALPENDLKARLLNLLAVLQDSYPGKGGVPKNLKYGANTPPAQAASPPFDLKTQDDFSGSDMPSLEKLAQKAEGAWAKITVDQLASQPQNEGVVALHLNIPFTEGEHVDNVKLRIASEGSAVHDEAFNPAWTAAIELQPPGMGTFNARIVWNGHRIDACLWADKEETTALLSSATETLRARLEQAGLEAGALTVLDRPPPSTPIENDIPPLLDLHV